MPSFVDTGRSLVGLVPAAVMPSVVLPVLVMYRFGTDEDVLTFTPVAVTALLFTNHANVAAPSAMAATSTMAIAAPSCFFRAFVSITDPFPIPFLRLWNQRPTGSCIP